MFGERHHRNTAAFSSSSFTILRSPISWPPRRRIYLPPLAPARGGRIHALCDVDAVDGVEEGSTGDADDDNDGDDVGGGKG